LGPEFNYKLGHFTTIHTVHWQNWLSKISTYLGSLGSVTQKGLFLCNIVTMTTEPKRTYDWLLQGSLSEGDQYG
jgi:hypothetical protein